MNLDARKFGTATAIVAAIFWLVGRLLVLAGPYGPIRGGGYVAHGYMMRGPMLGGYRYGQLHGLGWNAYFAGLVAGLIVFPLVAGIAAWATATIYNRLLARARAERTDSEPQ
jgi:hypothetical protein